MLCFSPRFQFGPFLSLLVLFSSASSLPLRGCFGFRSASLCPSSLLVRFLVSLVPFAFLRFLATAWSSASLSVRSFLCLPSCFFVDKGVAIGSAPSFEFLQKLIKFWLPWCARGSETLHAHTSNLKLLVFFGFKIFPMTIIAGSCFAGWLKGWWDRAKRLEL